ncbi:hypothetical protein CS022_22320 [Veronia nyctiphanis]|uniref:DUF2059 domain-containing protein n=1 Tax=Veronia nyctiphanis TaxID=1278244 RepID=A0A4Q0YJ84_9GAMM|nr:hypothetical protein [Veronia nyctiphanis]RXJ70767.1 hypothetical protein CS022_22320 [Veronia nyctiphanis]
MKKLSLMSIAAVLLSLSGQTIADTPEEKIVFEKFVKGLLPDGKRSYLKTRMMDLAMTGYESSPAKANGIDRVSSQLVFNKFLDDYFFSSQYETELFNAYRKVFTLEEINLLAEEYLKDECQNALTEELLHLGKQDSIDPAPCVGLFLGDNQFKDKHPQLWAEIKHLPAKHLRKNALDLNKQFHHQSVIQRIADILSTDLPLEISAGWTLESVSVGYNLLETSVVYPQDRKPLKKSEMGGYAQFLCNSPSNFFENGGVLVYQIKDNKNKHLDSIKFTLDDC